MYTTNIKTYFHDADPAGILFYGNLFKLAHSAYENMMKAICPDEDIFASNEYAVPITHTEADYYIPIQAGSEMVVSVVVSELKDSSFELSYQFNNMEGLLKAQAKTVHVVVSKSDFKKMEIPEAIKKALEANKSQ